MDGTDEVSGPLHTAMFLAIVLGSLADDVTRSPDVRLLADVARETPLLIAYHWAGHHYLKDCAFNIWHGDE